MLQELRDGNLAMVGEVLLRDKKDIKTCDEGGVRDITHTIRIM